MSSSNDTNISILASLPKQCAWFVGVGGAIIYAILLFYEISNSASSTAAISYFFIPPTALIALMVFSLYGFLPRVVLQGILAGNYRYQPRFFCALFIILMFKWKRSA